MQATRLLLLATTLAVWAAGCGYTTGRLTDFPSARTIAVVPFDNTGYRRDLELRLTEAVVREIRQRTDLAIAAPNTADLVISGRMSAVEDAIGLDAQQQPIQKRLRGTLDVTVTERTTGRVVRQAVLNAQAEFRPMTAGESLAGSATDEWTERMAERVVYLLERSF